MADSASTKSDNVSKRDLVVSVGSFDGFQWKNGRLSLGWVSFASTPRDLESRLEKAAQEIDALKAELDRVSAEAEQTQRVVQENKELRAQLGRISSEIARLQALMERVSSGVR